MMDQLIALPLGHGDPRFQCLGKPDVVGGRRYTAPVAQIADAGLASLDVVEIRQ